MRYLISLLFLGIAGFMFFAFADPMYKSISALRLERDGLNENLENLRKLAKLRDDLLVQYNAISASDRQRLSKILPADVASDQLMVEINNLASQNGLAFKKIDIAGIEQSAGSRLGAPSGEEVANAGGIESPKISFNVSGAYQGFRLFLEDLESHIRIIDIDQISFNAAEGAGGLINVDIKGMTYWEK